MAKDLPTYERGGDSKISVESSNPQAAYGRAAQAALTGMPKENSFDKFVSNLTQDAANKMARDSAIEAAKTPGQKFLPFGEAGKVYDSVYEQVSFQNVTYEGTRALRGIYQAGRNVPIPNDKMLEDYEEQGKAAMMDSLSQLPEHQKEEARHQLLNTYEQGFYDLSNRVQKENVQYLRNQSDLFYAQKAGLMATSAFEASSQKFLKGAPALSDKSSAADKMEASAYAGGGKDAKEYEKEALAVIASAENENLITPEIAEQRREALTLKREIAAISGEAAFHAKEGTTEGFLEELKNGDRLKGLSPGVREQVLMAAEGTVAHYDAALSSSQYLNNLQADASLENGSLDGMGLEYWQERLSPKAFAKLSNKAFDKQMKSIEGARKGIEINENAGNSLWLSSNTTSAEVEAHTQRLIDMRAKEKGAPLSILEEAETISGLRAPNPLLSSHISTAFESQNTAMIADASDAYSLLERMNPAALSGVGEKTRALALSISDKKSQQGMSPVDAINAAMKNIVGVNDKEFELRERVIKEGDDFKKYRDVDQWRTNAANLMGVGVNEVSGGLPIAAYEALKDGYRINGNMEDAKKFAAARLKRRWGMSAINGEPELMESAPELWMEDGDKYAKRQLTDKISGIAQVSQERFEKGEIDYKYEIFTPPIPPRTRALSSPKEPDLSLRKVFRDENIKPIEGKVKLKSDMYTRTPEDMGENPSYNLVFYSPLHGPMALENPLTAQIERMILDPEIRRVEVEAERKRLLELDTANKKKAVKGKAILLADKSFGE